MLELILNNSGPFIIAIIQLTIVFSIVLHVTRKNRTANRNANHAKKAERLELNKERARVSARNRARRRYKNMRFDLRRPKEFRKWQALIVAKRLKKKYEKKLSPTEDIMQSYMSSFPTMHTMMEISSNFQYMYELFKKINVKDMQHKAPVYGIILGRMVCLDDRLENICDRALLYNELETLALAEEDRIAIDSEILVLLFESRKLRNSLQAIVLPQQAVAPTSAYINPGNCTPPQHSYYTT